VQVDEALFVAGRGPAGTAAGVLRVLSAIGSISLRIFSGHRDGVMDLGKEGIGMDLKGRGAVVTGGAMGIGLATSRRLVREGCAVTLWDLNATALEGAKKELNAMGGRCSPTSAT